MTSALATATNGMLRSAQAVHEAASRIVQNRVPSDPSLATGDSPGAVSAGTTESDLIEEFVIIKQAEITYTASAHVIQSEEGMSKTLLSILA